MASASSYLAVASASVVVRWTPRRGRRTAYRNEEEEACRSRALVEGEACSKRKAAPDLGEEPERRESVLVQRSHTLVKGEACGKEGDSGLGEEGERLAAP
jgi:hypothetical protein